ncbi:hypothetical protein JL04_11265 [Gallibacterium anatis]|nr:hypothetical protein JL04_11265 [Gallibacterium anatis]
MENGTIMYPVAVADMLFVASSEAGNKTGGTTDTLLSSVTNNSLNYAGITSGNNVYFFIIAV